MDTLCDLKMASSADHFTWYLVNICFILYGDLIPVWAQALAAISILLQIYQLYTDVFRILKNVNLVLDLENSQFLAPRMLVAVSTYYYIKVIIPAFIHSVNVIGWTRALFIMLGLPILSLALAISISFQICNHAEDSDELQWPENVLHIMDLVIVALRLDFIPLIKDKCTSISAKGSIKFNI